MKEIFESIIHAARERMVSPFFGVYLISWIVVNYKAILIILLSNQEIIYRLDEATKNSGSIWHVVGTPFLISILYLISSPWANYFIFKIRNMPTTKGKEAVIEQLTTIAEKKDRLVNAETNLELQKLRLEKNRKAIELDAKLKELELQDRETLKEIDRSKIELKKKESELEIKEGSLKELEKRVKEETDIQEERKSILDKEIRDKMDQLDQLDSQTSLMLKEMKRKESYSDDIRNELFKLQSEYEYLLNGIKNAVNSSKMSNSERMKFIDILQSHKDNKI